MQRRTRTRVMVHHSNVPRTRTRQILACNTLELLASIDHRVYTGNIQVINAAVHLIGTSTGL